MNILACRNSLPKLGTCMKGKGDAQCMQPCCTLVLQRTARVPVLCVLVRSSHRVTGITGRSIQLAGARQAN